MKLAKKLGLTVSAIIFCLSIFVVSGNAQNYGNRRWENRRNNNSSSVFEYQRRQNRRVYNQQRRSQRQRYLQYNWRNRNWSTPRYYNNRRYNRYYNRGYNRSYNNRRYRRNW